MAALGGVLGVMDFDWKALVKTVAPAIASTFGTPLMGLGVKALVEALLPGNPEATEEDIVAALQGATPETLLAIKKADQDFAVQMKRLDIDLARIDADDRDSARNREVQLKSKAPALLATVTVCGFFAVLYALLSGAAIMPKEYELLTGGLIGGLVSVLNQIYNYYFGSSAGSAAKTAMFDRITKTKS